MDVACRVALLGFSAFERDSLRAFFRLAAGGSPYSLAESIVDARFIVADADLPDCVAAVRGTGRGGDTVFVGAAAPYAAMARLPRPVDPLAIVRELNALQGIGCLRAGAAALPPVRPARDAPPAATKPLDVLVVDHAATARRQLGSLLEGIGLRATLAPNSRRAIECLAQRRYAFVLLDVALGADSDLDGLMLCRHIKQHRAVHGGARVVLMTAAASGTERVRGNLAGCDAYLSKPVEAGLFAHTLQRLAPDAFAPREPRPSLARGQ